MTWKIGLLIIPFLLLTGCIDTSGREICKKAIDNLKPTNDYKVIDYKSDFISGNENAYFVWFLISNESATYWIGERPNEYFIYWYAEDELVYEGDNSTIKSWIYNVVEG